MIIFFPFLFFFKVWLSFQNGGHFKTTQEALIPFSFFPPPCDTQRVSGGYLQGTSGNVFRKHKCMTIVLACREALGGVLYQEQIQAHAHFWLMGALHPLKLKLLSLYPT
jgi:hypothetical protein